MKTQTKDKFKDVKDLIKLGSATAVLVATILVVYSYVVIQYLVS